MKKIKEHISERTFIIIPKKQMVIKCIFVLALLLLPVSISAETLLPPVIPSEQRNDFAGTVGMDFYITDTGSRVVDSLGFYDDGQEGLQAAHRVAVWNDTTGLKIAEVTVPSGTGGYLHKGFRYAPIPSGPITLNANTAYTIGAETFVGVDSWPNISREPLNPYYVGSYGWWCRYAYDYSKPLLGEGQSWTYYYIYGAPNMAQVTTAHNPSPGNETTATNGAPVGNQAQVNISFNAARNASDLSEVNANVTGHYLYLKANSMNFSGVTPIYIPAGAPGPNETALYEAILDLNTYYYWRVDESINGSSATSPQTITGPLWSFTTIAKQQVQIAVDPDRRYQLFEGFGTSSMHQWTPVWYENYSEAVRDGIMDTFYTLNNNGLGAEICRFFMPHGDNPDHDHQVIPECGMAPFEPEDGVFDWDGHECILWAAQGASDRGAIMFTYEISPPYWMTVSGCTAGGVNGASNMIPGMEWRYAQHVAEELKHFRDAWGINFDYVTVMGEAEQDWWVDQGNSPGCHMESDQAVTLLRETNAALSAYGLDAKITAFDPFGTEYTDYLDDILQSDIEPDLPIITTHQYSSTVTSMQTWKSRADQYDKRLWQTEWGNWWDAGWPDDRPLEQSQSYADAIHDALKIMKVNAWIIWEPALVFDGQPQGLVPRKAYWPIAHYSRHVRPGMQMIEAAESFAEAKTTAFIDPAGPGDRHLEIITYNSGNALLSVDYDLAAFEGVQILQVRRSDLNASNENYNSITFNALDQGVFSLDIAAKTIVTISAQYPGCTLYIPGDISGPQGQPDCYINMIDLSMLLQSWLTIDPSVNLIDAASETVGQISLFDISILAGNWMECNDKDDPGCTWTQGP
ncbi:MAG: glycoside hydrolase [Planctomycetota bacterium]|jgi:O-glycosyl hydrolase